MITVHFNFGRETSVLANVNLAIAERKAVIVVV